MTPANKWITYRLDEIAKIQGGGTPRRSESSYFGGAIPWVTPTDLPAIGIVSELNEPKEKITEEGLSRSSAKLIDSGSVLFSSRASVGKIAVTNEACTTNQGFANFTPHEGIVDRWFLAYLLSRFTPEIINLAGKTTLLEVPRSKLKAFEVALPPLSEQLRIVARIKKCMERVEEIERLRAEGIEEAKCLFQARCAELFALDWSEVPVRELITEKPANGIFKRRKDFGEGALLANVKNLYGDQVIHPDELERVRANDREIDKFCLKPGDILERV